MMHWETLRYTLAERTRAARIYSWVAFFVLLATTFVTTCMMAQAPRIADAHRFYPDYQAAYAAAVACTGVQHPAPYQAVVWMSVPRENFTDPLAPNEEGKLPNIGEWISPDTIYVAQGWTASWVPKHELIHYLRRDGKHPREVFGDACHAMWGYLEPDTTPSLPGRTIYGPAWTGQ